MSDEDDNKSNDTSRVIEGHQEEPEDEEMATTTTSLSDRVNVQQILESMTNAFNNSMNKKSDSPEKKNNVDKIDTTDNTDNEKTQNYPKKIDNTKLAAENKKSSDCNVNDEVDKPDEIILKDTTTDKNKDNELLGKQESKKDGNIPRIVLTFRTIDETTDDGRKTKISSCGSNLSLVPDELGHCDKIGGVSVKIEHSEEQVKKSANKQSSENKEINSKKNSQGKDINETKDSLLLDADNNKKEDCEKGLKIKNNGAIEDSNKMKNEETNNDAVKPDDGNNGEALVTRKRKYKCRTRESLVNAPEPKRSARRSSKEAFSVLESAMARKEKSYYTEESKRKYTKPCKPKKVSNTKEKESSKQSKSTRGEINSDSNTILNNSTTSNSPEPTPEKSKKSNSDFDGMPKLSPMVKKSQITDSKTTNDLLNNEDHSLDNKPFLRPFTGKNKRERVRSRGGYVARKLTKSESQFEDPPSPAAEAGKTNDYPEEANVVTKRTRRSLVPSPSPAEGQASKPESTAISTESYEEQLICLCQVRSQLYVTITGTGTPLYCTAIDSIDNRLIGCCNEVDSNDVAMRRPSTRVPFIILCRSHKERLVRHNCCPSCGLFCTQGKFLQCTNGHQYHLDCDTIINKKSVCPHCASDCQKHTVLITMSGTRKPVYIPTRKQFSKLPSAKMSLPGKGDNTILAEKPPSLLVKPDDIKIPEPSLNSDKSERFTVMSLYTAVKNEDLEKLVNVLASGYSANHIFREYGQRTVLHLAAQRGHLACVHILVQAGCQLDVMDKSQLTPLMLAATNGNIDVVRYLVRVGADVTLKGQDGMTALHMAAKSGHLEACKIIISECKIPKTLVDSIDDGGWTSLIWACEFCHVDVARFLIDKKCDPLIRDSEQNIALHWSAYSGSSEITEMLLNEDCDVNSVNVHGDTPLHIAARQDKYAVSVLLLARGAKISEVNTAGETAMDCCSKPDGDTMAALRLNARINELTDSSMEKTIKILTNDISRGKERNPIQCVNGFDSEDKPTDFLYITDNCFTSNINVDRTITSLQSCHCEDNCTSEKCLCGNISLRCWYDEVGRLIPEFNYADPPMLFECNQACDCNRITCNNRVVQHGVTQRFQLFRTKGKGWGLKTLRSILKGTYVCEYVGEIISDSEADHREDDSYLFDLDNRDGETYCIDARRYGNIARFINHSCAPNLLPVRVFVEHQDLHFPRIAFFANRDIDADEELGFDYGEKFWIIKCKSFTCTCGALNCRYSEKVIQVTLDNYRQKIQLEENLATQRHI